MTTSPQPEQQPVDVEAEVLRYLEISDAIDRLNGELTQIKDRLRGLGPGVHAGPGEVRVSISSPPRTFDAKRAWGLLTPEQQALAVSPDSKKIKEQLSGVLVDMCMVDGTGAARVTVK